MTFWPKASLPSDKKLSSTLLVHDLFQLASISSIGWLDGLKHNQLKHSHVQAVHPLTILAE